MPRQSFGMQLLCYERVGFEVCFYTVVRPAKGYFRDTADGNDPWVPTWTAEQIAFPGGICSIYCADYAQNNKSIEIPIHLVGYTRRNSSLRLPHIAVYYCTTLNKRYFPCTVQGMAGCVEIQSGAQIMTHSFGMKPQEDEMERLNVSRKIKAVAIPILYCFNLKNQF